MNTPTISIIVPIYNVEKYLARALASLQAQTYPHWQAILVNDGSTDQSGTIAHTYAASDSRFVCLNKSNGGLSDARNAGLNCAHGTYIMFLDADDFLHPQAMELCINAIERDKSDIVAYTYDHYYRTRNLIRHYLKLPEAAPRPRNYTNVEYLVTDNIFDYATEYSRPKDIDKRWAVKHCQVWRCLYRASTIDGIRFIKGINYEDFPWWSEVLLHVERCTILNLPLYYYYPNPRSYIFSASQNHKAQSIEAGIAAAIKLYENAPQEKRLKWEKNFLTPFCTYLEKKKHKLGEK